MLRDQIEDFLMNCGVKHLSVKTIKSYNLALQMMANYFEEKGITDAEQIKSNHIIAYIDYLLKRPKNSHGTGQMSKITINGYIRDMKAFFTFLYDFDYIPKNPMLKIKQLKVERPPVDFVDDGNFKLLLKNMDSSKFVEYRDKILIQMLLDTGMRIGECLMIKDEHIDYLRNRVYLPWENTKGKKARYIFFSDEMRKLLKQWQRHRDLMVNTDYLFCNLYGKKLEINSFEHNLKEYGLRVGLNITPKVFRNNFAKRFLLNGGDIFTLSKILGHSSVTVTEKAYLDLDDEDIRRSYQKYSPLSNLSKK